MRLIDADKLFPYGSVPFIQDDGFRTADRIYGIIKKAPTVDAVEVVRCKDCQHCNIFQYKTTITTMMMCMIHSFELVDPTDFCSRGERKDNG